MHQDEHMETNPLNIPRRKDETIYNVLSPNGSQGGEVCPIVMLTHVEHSKPPSAAAALCTANWYAARARGKRAGELVSANCKAAGTTNKFPSAQTVGCITRCRKHDQQKTLPARQCRLASVATCIEWFLPMRGTIEVAGVGRNTSD